MTVKEAKDLLGYGVIYEIQGAYSGKTYHKSYVNSSKNFDKYADREVTVRDSTRGFFNDTEKPVILYSANYRNGTCKIGVVGKAGMQG